MKIPKETVHQWATEWANTPSIATSCDPMEYIAQRAAEWALEEAAKVCDAVQDEYGRYTFTARVSAERIRSLKGEVK